MLVPLVKLIFCLYFTLFLFVLILLTRSTLICKVNFLHLLRAIKDPLVLAFSTASSETALPSLLERLQEFGVPKHIATFVLPTGYSFNLDGGVIYSSMAVLFVSQAYGIHLGASQQIMIILTLMVMTKGMAAVPGNAMIMLAATSAAFGLPVEGVALVLGIDRILDMGRTCLNVTGDVACTTAVAYSEGEFFPADDQQPVGGGVFGRESCFPPPPAPSAGGGSFAGSRTPKRGMADPKGGATRLSQAPSLP